MSPSRPQSGPTCAFARLLWRCLFNGKLTLQEGEILPQLMLARCSGHCFISPDRGGKAPLHDVLRLELADIGFSGSFRVSQTLSPGKAGNAGRRRKRRSRGKRRGKLSQKSECSGERTALAGRTKSKGPGSGRRSMALCNRKEGSGRQREQVCRYRSYEG